MTTFRPLCWFLLASLLVVQPAQADLIADYWCEGIAVPDRPPFGGRIALTFDDGPNARTTPMVLSILRRYGIPATFFINRAHVRDDPTWDQIWEIANDPLFELANHSQHHYDMSLLSRADVAAEVDATTSVLWNVGQTPRYFRFPFGQASCQAADVVRGRGYHVVGWHVDSADWCYGLNGGYCSPADEVGVPDDVRSDMATFIRRQLHASDGGIILFHDPHLNTANRLEGLILEWKRLGYTFTSLDDWNTFPVINQ